MNITPKKRVFRTIVQTTLGVLAAVPAAVALLPITASVALAVCGVAGAATILISAAQNAYDASHGDV